MNVSSKTNQELIEEISVLRRRIRELEKSESGRKQSKEELKASKDFIEAVLDNITDSLIVIDPSNYTIITANQNFLNDYGLNKDTVIGRRCHELTHNKSTPCSPPNNICPLVETLKTEKPSTAEHIHYDSNGSEQYIEVSTIPTISKEGKVHRIIHLSRNITERKRIEETLKASEEKHRALFESSRDAIMTLAPPSWRFTTGNPATVDMFATGDEAAFTALGPWELSPEFQPDGRPSSEKAAEMIQTAMAKGSHFFEWTHRRLRGESFPATVLLTRMEIGEQTLLQATVRDITDQKKAEEAQRQSKRDFSTLVENAADMIVRFDADRRYVYCNEAIERQFGIPVSEFIGKTPLETGQTREQTEPIDEALRHVLETGQDHEVEQSYSTSTGLKYFSTHIVPEYDKRGEIESLLAITRDITDRKRSEDALRKSEERFRAIFMQAAVGVAEVEMSSGRFVSVNPCLCEMVGRTVEEILATTFQSITHPDDLHLHEDETALLIAEKIGHYEIEKRYIRKDGAIIWVNLTSSPLWRPGEPSARNLIVVQNITDRMQLNEKLHDSETRFRQLANSSWEGILIQRDGIILDVNQALLDMFGYDAAEAIGKSVLDFIAPEFTEQAIQALAQQTTQPSILHLEGKGRKKDGTVFPIEILGRPFTHNNLPARVTAIRDLTKQKQAEADKEKLEAQNRQLQKSESLGRMAGAIAHHFNNQLGIVIGNLEMAMNDLPQAAERVHKLSTAMQAAEKAAETSSLMLTYLGQSFDKLEPLELSDACIRGLPMLRAVIPSDVVLEHDLPIPGPIIGANANQIQQVLTNLITNAWEATDEKRCVIHLNIKTVSAAEIPTANRHPIEWRAQNRAYACLEVIDTGSGIADKDIEKIFDPFFSSKFTGRGMGLAVVLGIVKAHGGVITVESEPGLGSAFRVFLPVTEEAILRLPDDTIQVSKVEEGGTVLLVEDEEMVRDMAVDMLKRLSFKVIEAKDGVEAVEMFRQRRDEIRFVLSDLTMPRMDGWETLTALRRLAPGIPVILTSGYDKAKVMAGDHPELPQVFLGKPYKLKGLSDAIRQALVNRT